MERNNLLATAGFFPPRDEEDSPPCPTIAPSKAISSFELPDFFFLSFLISPTISVSLSNAAPTGSEEPPGDPCSSTSASFLGQGVGTQRSRLCFPQRFHPFGILRHQGLHLLEGSRFYSSLHCSRHHACIQVGVLLLVGGHFHHLRLLLLRLRSGKCSCCSCRRFFGEGILRSRRHQGSHMSTEVLHHDLHMTHPLCKVFRSRFFCFRTKGPLPRQRKRRNDLELSEPALLRRATGPLQSPTFSSSVVEGSTRASMSEATKPSHTTESESPTLDLSSSRQFFTSTLTAFEKKVRGKIRFATNRSQAAWGTQPRNEFSIFVMRIKRTERPLRNSSGRYTARGYSRATLPSANTKSDSSVEMPGSLIGWRFLTTPGQRT